MNPLLLILISLTFGLTTKAQSETPPLPAVPLIATQAPPYPHQDKCGDPRRESTIWSLLSGRVVQVIDGNTIKVVLKDKKRKLITLAAIDTPKLGQTGGDDARNRLSELVLNKEVEIWIEPKLEKHSKLPGVVYVQARSINLELIESGAARYKQPASYTMSNYQACLYRIAEGEARAAMRGLWRRGSN